MWVSHKCVCVCIPSLLSLPPTHHPTPLGRHRVPGWARILVEVMSSERRTTVNCKPLLLEWGTSLVAQMVKRLPAMRETWVQSLGQEDPLEKEMATQSSTLAWKIPWMEELGRLQSMGSQTAGHDWATSFHVIRIDPLWALLQILLEDTLLLFSKARIRACSPEARGENIPKKREGFHQGKCLEPINALLYQSCNRWGSLNKYCSTSQQKDLSKSQNGFDKSH